MNRQVFNCIVSFLMCFLNLGVAVNYGTEFIVASFSRLQALEYYQIILEYNSSETVKATVLSQNTTVPFLRTPGNFNQSSCGRICEIYTERFTHDVVTVVSSRNVSVLGSICSKQMQCKIYQVYPIKSLLTKYEVSQESNFTSCSVASSADKSTLYVTVKTGNVSEVVITFKKTIYQFNNNTMRFNLQRLETFFINKSGNYLPSFLVNSDEPFAIFCGERNTSGIVVSMKQIHPGVENNNVTKTTPTTETTTLSSKGQGTICNMTIDYCPCFKWYSLIQKGNLTMEQDELKQAIKNTLTINKTELSSYRRKKTSARDNRPSSQGLGYFGAIIITCVVIFIIFEDVISLLLYLDNKRQKHFSSVK